MSAGKGDKPRPVNKTKFDENYDNIFRKAKVSQLNILQEKYKSLVCKKSIEGMRLLDEIEKIQNENF